MSAAISQMTRNLNGSKPVSEFGQAAEAYARRGWHVFPLGPRTKSGQLLQSWTREASADVERVRQWWRRWPDANVGIACGPSRLLVVDLDGDEGRETWERLAADHGIAPSPLVSVTGSGGRHLVYTLPEGMRNTAKKLGPGIDTRAAGGYIVAAPSVHPNGERYAWADTTAEPATCPAVLIDLLAREPDPWRDARRSLHNLTSPREPVEYVIDGWFARRSVNLLYAAPGDYKTMIAIAMALSVASGNSLFSDPQGNGGRFTTPGPVFWFDFDSGEDVLAERVAAFARALRLADDAPFALYTMPPRFDAANSEHVADMIVRCRGAALIVFDTLTHIKGTIDSNSDDMTAVMEGLRAIACATGAAVLVLHHQRKQSNTPTRDGDTIRGSSAIEAGLDTASKVKRDGQRLKLEMTKNRRGLMPSVTVEFSFDHQADGRTLDKARFWPVDAVREAREELEARCISELEAEGEMSQSQIVKAVKARKELVIAALGRLHLAGRLTVADGPHGRKLYAIR